MKPSYKWANDFSHERTLKLGETTTKQFTNEEIRRLVPEEFLACYIGLGTGYSKERAFAKHYLELLAELERVKEENQRLREVLENTKKNVEFAIFRLKQQTKGADRCMTN